MPSTVVNGSGEYREAMLRGASLAWEERWEAAATAYRRALAARPGDPAAQRQLALVSSRSGGPVQSMTTVRLAEPPVVAGPSLAASDQPFAPAPANGALLGRTASAHLSELSDLPREIVRSVVEGLQAIERHQEAGRYRAAFEDAFALLQRVPSFLPLHVLLAELYSETGRWQAARDKLDAVQAAYATRVVDDRGAAAA